MDARKTKTVVLNRGSSEEKRQEIREYFHETFSIEERLYDILAADDAFYLRPEPLRHPLIFYFGHTATFYLNKLIVAGILDRRINPKFESMFAVGVDEMSWDDLDETHYDWPEVSEVRAYREQIRESVDRVIDQLELTMPIGWKSPFWLILMGIEHQRIHLETSSVIIRRLPIDLVRPLPGWEICPEAGKAPENELVSVKGGPVVLGKSKEHPLYGWDNEYGHHEFDVWDFSASRYLVSNEEYLRFVEDGGYHKKALWTEEGQQWLDFTEANHPLFWQKTDHGYKLRTMAEVIDMPWNWPVEVNYLEAKAFCNWLGERTDKRLRLPTEEEWRRLYDLHEIPDQPYWDVAPGNINLEHWASPAPVDRFRFGQFYDLIGNVWQWTETPISGFDGFEVHPCYDDFSAPTFDTKHNLIKGGSWISTGNEATRDARYAFRRHFFQHAGFRYVKSRQPVARAEAKYETDPAVARACEAYYGPRYFNVDNFPLRCVQHCLKWMQGREKQKALNLGCSVGRAAFELAQEFRQVTGIDFSARFIRIAFAMQQKGTIFYELPEEGEIVSYHQRRLADFGLGEVAGRVEFHQGDAENLKPRFTDYDLILAANLIDHLRDPRQFLSTIHTRLKSGGLLVLASTCHWRDSHTKRENWIGGFRKDGELYTTLDGLTECLCRHFERLDQPQDIEYIVRHSAREFQHHIAQITVWERNDRT